MTTPAPAAAETVAEAWLTRLRLNPANRQVQQDLRNAVNLHRRIMRLVPDGLGDSPRAQAGVLFRVDTDGVGAPVVLVQTRVAPAPGRLPTGYAQAQTRDMGPMFTALRSGLPVRYRILGNAVRRCGRNSTAGKWKQAIVLHGDEADQWWAERAAAAGLQLHTILSESADSLTAWHEPKDKGAKERGGATRVPHVGTLFQGTATVHDPEALRDALLHGIGRSKSYGCGLLSLAPGGSGV